MKNLLTKLKLANKGITKFILITKLQFKRKKFDLSSWSTTEHLFAPWARQALLKGIARTNRTNLSWHLSWHFRCRHRHRHRLRRRRRRRRRHCRCRRRRRHVGRIRCGARSSVRCRNSCSLGRSRSCWACWRTRCRGFDSAPAWSGFSIRGSFLDWWELSWYDFRPAFVDKIVSSSPKSILRWSAPIQVTLSFGKASL